MDEDNLASLGEDQENDQPVSKRRRKANFTELELITLVREVKKRAHIIFSRLCETLTIRHKEREWDEIAAAVNQVSPVPRNTNEIRKKWDNYRGRVLKTGNSKHLEFLDNYELDDPASNEMGAHNMETAFNSGEQASLDTSNYGEQAVLDRSSYGYASPDVVLTIPESEEKQLGFGSGSSHIRSDVDSSSLPVEVFKSMLSSTFEAHNEAEKLNTPSSPSSKMKSKLAASPSSSNGFWEDGDVPVSLLQPICNCPELVLDTLPQRIWQYACNGHVKEVDDWLVNEGDVNAATQDGDTLLSAAASRGRFEVLKVLFAFPSVHVNTYHQIEGSQSYTPLWFAAANGHLECVQLFLQTKLECNIDLTGSKDKGVSAAVIAAQKNHWNIVLALLNNCKVLNWQEAKAIIQTAVIEMRWDIVLKVINQSSQLNADFLRPLLDQALERDQWDITCAILKKNFRYKFETLCKVLSKNVEARRWDRVNDLLRMMKEPMSFHILLAEAALAEREKVVCKLLDTSRYSYEVMNGSLVVIAAGGTSDEIAKALYSSKHFSDTARECVLYLSVLNGHLEFLQLVLSRKSHYKFTYHSLCRAQQVAEEMNNAHVNRVMSKVLEMEAETIALDYHNSKRRHI